MKYVNATTVLPEHLLAEIQKYVQGEALYIPKPKTAYQPWGSRSGARQQTLQRNAAIREAFQQGAPIDALAAQYFLAVETIKRIVYTKS